MKSAAGTIRKKIIVRGGKEYAYWEARYTAGYDPGTGKQIQKSVSGKTQREVARKLREAQAKVDAGDFSEPSKMTLAGWMEKWQELYLVSQKPLTVKSYQSIIKNHIIPGLGAVKLSALTTDQVQQFYRKLDASPKTVKNVHGVLHKALAQAVTSRLISHNPADGCVLERVRKPQIKPLDQNQISAFLQAASGTKYADLYTVILFLGLREGEALGLTWDCVNFDTGTVTIRQQLLSGSYELAPTKNGESRTITAAPTVMQVLKAVHAAQLKNRLLAGELYHDSSLVFTNELGGHLCHVTVYKAFKEIVSSIGIPSARLHDLRHTYAVSALQAGDDIKTVQENLGHATAAFTLDVYGHVTDRMKQASADRMEAYIQGIKIS